MIPPAAHEMCRETGPGDRYRGASKDDEGGPCRESPPLPSPLSVSGPSLSHRHFLCPLDSAIQNQDPRSGLFFLHLGNGMIRGQIPSNVDEEIIEGKKETRVSFYTI